MRIMGRLKGIAIRAKTRAPMQELTEVEITLEGGLVGDSRGKRHKVGGRQITLLSSRQWRDVCMGLGTVIPWTARRANLLIETPHFGPEMVGRKLYIQDIITFAGPILEITGETDPCSRMDEVHPGLKKALSKNWRGGVTCRVIQPGKIRINSWVSFV